MTKLSFFCAVVAAILFLTLASFMTTSILNAQTYSGPLTDWHLSIGGLVNYPLNLTLEDITAMPQTSVEAAIYCVDFPTRVVLSGKWTGVRLATLLGQAEVLPSAVKVAFYAADGYSTDLDLQTANRDDVIVAYEMDGALLAETFRLVVPGKWGYKWISYVNRITLVNYDFRGRWESQGYSDEAEANIQSGTSVPDFSLFTPYQPTPNLPNEPGEQSTNSQSPNSTNIQPSEEMKDANPGVKPGTSSYLPADLIVLGVVAAVIIGACLAIYVKECRE